jgi:hypothetical protein
LAGQTSLIAELDESEEICRVGEARVIRPVAGEWEYALVRVKVEILRWDAAGEQPTLLHVLSHDCHSLEAVREGV